MSDLEFVRNDLKRRLEARLDGELVGAAYYRLRPGVVSFTHTEVDGSTEGQGVGSELARAALDQARDEGLLVRPYCPFIRAWIERHPDYADLVDPSWHPRE